MPGIACGYDDGDDDLLLIKMIATSHHLTPHHHHSLPRGSTLQLPQLADFFASLIGHDHHVMACQLPPTMAEDTTWALARDFPMALAPIPIVTHGSVRTQWVTMSPYLPEPIGEIGGQDPN